MRVLQGSILDGIVHKYYRKCLQYYKIYLYSDDPCLFISNECNSSVNEECNSSLATLIEWSEAYQLCLGTDKTLEIKFHSYKKVQRTINCYESFIFDSQQ